MITTVGLLLALMTLHFPLQETTPAPPADPLEQRVAVLELKDDTLGNALGRVNQTFDISISIEGVLPEEGIIANPKFSVNIENRTIAEVLDQLCRLDTRYVWTRDGNNVNLFPKASLNDRNYFFDRVLPELDFRDLRELSDAIVAIDHQADDPRGGVILMGIGQTHGFADPWTQSFNNLTVRQALNRIARRLGPTYGWQIGGTNKARLIVFHYKLQSQHVELGGQYPSKH
jgi:hypothetical protein